MKLRVYIDTSVVGGYFDDEFEGVPNFSLTEFSIRTF